MTRGALWFGLSMAAALCACGDADGGDGGGDGGAADGAVGDGSARDDAAMGDDDGAADGAVITSSDPLPEQDSWGPDILGLADDVGDDGTADDVAFGVFWDLAQSTIVFDDGGCVAVHNDADAVPRRDVGDVVITGGSGDDPVVLATNDDRYYYLGDEIDPWAEGDALGATVEGAAMGPLEVPSAFTDDNFDALPSVSRSDNLVLTFGGSDASHVAVSLGVGDDSGNLTLVCLGRAGGGSYTIPAAAFDVIGTRFAEVSLKLSPTNLQQVGDVAFFTAGVSKSRTLQLLD